MNRRDALYQIGGLSLALFLFESCQGEPHVSLQRLSLEDGDYTLVHQYVQAILPYRLDDRDYQSNRTLFVLNYLDKTMSSIDLDKFGAGMRAIKGELIEVYNKAPQDAEHTNLITLFNKIGADRENNEMKYFFLEKVKSATLNHHLNSEVYMTEKLGYKFVPGTYIGCVQIQHG